MDQPVIVRARRLPLVLQGIVVLTALLGAIFYPSVGHPAVLIALDGSPSATAIAWSRRNGAPLVGLSKVGEAAVLRLPTASSPLAALRAGFLPIAADGGLCTDKSNSRRATQEGIKR